MFMLQPIFLLLIAPLLFSQGTPTSQANPSPAYEDAEAYEVYNAILPIEWPVTAAHAKRLVISIETTGYKMCLRPGKGSEEIFEPAIDEYVKLNANHLRLQPKFNLNLPYKLVTADDIKAAFGQAGWNGFYKQYPDSGGWIDLSAVGFNTDKTVAVVYVGHYCGELCGSGHFHVLQKKEGKWSPIKWRGEACAWIS
jgi:hypothetical protein